MPKQPGDPPGKVLRTASNVPARLRWRGTVEGFYGHPWSHEDRLAHLEFSAGVGFNAYVYAPKDDPYHRDQWREPYPPTELAHLAELARTAHELGIRFVFTISPGLSMRHSDDTEHASLAAKAGQLFDAGVRSFGLLFDDIPQEPGSPEDIARFGTGSGGGGAAHGETCARFVTGFMAERGIEDTLLVCPTDYAGTAPSAYRDELARTAPDDILITWTGPDIVVGTITGADIDLAEASYRRPLLLWDNFPVNDFDPTRLFLGPLTGRAARGERAALRGIIANPMPQAYASRIALTTVADWARDPDGYDATRAAEPALTQVTGNGARDLAPLVRVCGTWPPSADQDPELSKATQAALRGQQAALDVVDGRLNELAQYCRRAREPESLVAELQSWLSAAVATAGAGIAAVRLLQAFHGGAAEAKIAGLWAQAHAALRAADDHYENVLRLIVPPFVRAALQLTSPQDPGPRPAALLVTGPAPAPGDPAMTELLEARGFAVRRTCEPSPELIDAAALVVLGHTAEQAAIAAVSAVPVPLVTWRASVELGMAGDRKPVMCGGRLEIVAPGDPLAAGRSGIVRILRGPGWLSVADVEGTAATVVARTSRGDAAMLFHYRTGDPLADGTPAPGPRIGLFLGADGPARWLLTEDGRALVAAALGMAPDATP